MKISTLVFVAALPFAGVAEDFDDRLLNSTYPGIEVRESRPSGLAGLVELVLDNGQVVYINTDGTRLLAGNLLDLESGINLTELRRDGMRSDKLSNITIDDLFEYPAPEEKAVVTVVTDIDCPYCRRLHQQLADYHAVGISIRYLMMPRSGPGPASFKKASHAACAAEPAAALTLAMSGQELPELNCENSIRSQYDLAQSLQPTGTPAMITESGRIIHGYVPPARLAAELGLAAVE
jgi:thiol:disulfide interchange protein DsbC